MPGDITEALCVWNQNREAAVELLTPAVYAELRKIASSLMRRERNGHTLQPTALIHEAFVNIIRQDSVTWKDRAHFFGVAAHIMRQILVQHARKRGRLKRGAGAERVLDAEIVVDPDDMDVILDLDDALNRMAEWDKRKLSIVELHYFGGLTGEEISEALDLTLPTVRRDLLLGRAWLKEQFV